MTLNLKEKEIFLAKQLEQKGLILNNQEEHY